MRAISGYLIFIAVIIHLVTAWFSVGHYHDDEYYQILDFAAFKLEQNIQNSLMWEYTAQLRGAIQPFIAYITIKTLLFFGIESPFIWAFILRLFSLVLSLTGIIIFLKAIKKDIKNEKIYFWATLFLLFSWILVFMNVRFSSEGWTMSLFLIAYGFYLSGGKTKQINYFFIGLIFGFAFLCRYQTGLMLLGFGLWMVFIYKERWLVLSTIFAGGCSAILLGVLLDYWLYGSLSFSGWNYFENHIINRALENVLSEPWWFYGYYSAVQLIPPITLVLPVVVIVFWVLFYRHPVTWITIPFILGHHYFDHKEMRYLFPVLPFAPVMIAMLVEKIKDYKQWFSINPVMYFFKFIIWISFILNCVLVLLVMILPASKEVSLWQHCLSKNLVRNNDVLLVLDADGSFSNAGELELDFYNAGGIDVLSVSDEKEITNYLKNNPDNKYFYASRKKDRSEQLAQAGIPHKLECLALPDWVTSININDWVSRASLWRVWSLNQ